MAQGVMASRTAVAHGAVGSVAAAVLALSAFVRPTRGTDEVPLVAFLLSVAGVLVLGLGGWLGGELACTYGVRVARELVQEDGYRPKVV